MHTRFVPPWYAPLLLILLLTPALEVAAAQDGLDLANKIHYRPRPNDQASFSVMTLSGAGVDRVRELYQYRQDGARRGDTATLIRFVNPRDIAGTGLLTNDFAGSDDSDQWVYLPAAGRERRISSDRKGGKFLGSDFYFEDLRDRDPRKDNHRILGQTELDGRKMWQLESTPLDPDNSVYSKRIGWIDPATFTPMRLDYYVRGTDTPVKRWLVNRIERMGTFWVVTDRTMTDLQSGTSTRLVDVRTLADQGMDSNLFSRRALVDRAQQMEKKWRP